MTTIYVYVYKTHLIFSVRMQIAPGTITFHPYKYPYYTWPTKGNQIGSQLLDLSSIELVIWGSDEAIDIHLLKVLPTGTGRNRKTMDMGEQEKNFRIGQWDWTIENSRGVYSGRTRIH